MISRRKILSLLAGSGVAGTALVAPDETSSLFRSATEEATSTADSISNRVNAALENNWDTEKILTLTHETVNSVRADEGLSQVDWSDDLHQLATDYATRMAEEEFLSHTDPNGNGPSDRYEKRGIDCSLAGENLIKVYWEENFETNSGSAFYYTPNGLADGMVHQWMNSPEHRENILREYWQTEGIGVARNNDRVYAVQNFC